MKKYLDENGLAEYTVKIKEKMAFIEDDADNHPATRLIVDLIYPVGSYFKTTNTSFNPNTAWDGTTWVEDTDFVLVAYNHNGTISKNLTRGAYSGGIYQFTFTKPMANNNYVVSFSAEANGIGNELVGVYDRTTTGFKVDSCGRDGVPIELADLDVTVYGKLATPEYKTWKRTA